jgi:hypothetical protein
MPNPVTHAHREKPPALLIEALSKPVVISIDGEGREITKREAVTRLVDKSAGRDLRATRITDRHAEARREKAVATPPPEPAPFTERTTR